VAVAVAEGCQAKEEQLSNLEQALETRDVIGQAKGVLIGRMGVTPDAAFDMLRRASQRLNVKLRDVVARAETPQPTPPT
jgi:AmiR/NasT family two-component response regulator